MMTANMLDALLCRMSISRRPACPVNCSSISMRRNRFKGGLRYDRVDSSADRAAETSAGDWRAQPNACTRCITAPPRRIAPRTISVGCCVSNMISLTRR